MAAVERQHHAMHPDLALVAHRQLGDGRRVAAISHELRDAAMHARGQRLAPARLVRRRIQDGQVLRMAGHQGAAELERVLPCRARHLVHEALQVHAVLVGVDATPGADRHMRVAHRIFDEQVRHGVAELRVARLLRQTLQLPHVLAVLDSLRVQESIDRLPGHADVQSNELAALIDAGRQLALRDRPVEVVRLVLLAGPDQLHRDTGELLGDGDRLARVILRAAAPAEAAAEVELVDLASVERQSRLLGRGGERRFRILRRHPDFHPVRRDLGGRVHGLHRRVGEERRAVDGFHLLRGAFDRLERIAFLPTGERLAARGQSLLEARSDRRARLRRASAFIPDDRQRVERRLGPPPGVGNDADGRVVHFHDAMHTGPP